MALFPEHVMSYLCLAIAKVGKDDMLVSLEAASTFTLCSRVRSAAVVEKGFPVQGMLLSLGYSSAPDGMCHYWPS